ncbi:MAG: hypothetical protein IJ391_02530, partial [Clostridia bacterium]|nr:hypothetical protein [Clostridia bacterium]
DKLKIPTLFTEGWYDFYIDGMFDMWSRLPKSTKSRSALVVGPWGHGTTLPDDSVYPIDNGGIPDDSAVRFFNSIRDNTPHDTFKLGQVNYYSVAGDFWTTDEHGTDEMKLYFNADGTLTDKASGSGEQSYIYDPDKPLDYFKFHSIFKTGDPVDGVLSFVSPPFQNDTDFYGKIRWCMKVKSNCDDTAFFMRVYFVEDGVAYNLTETITSLSSIDESYRAGDECTIDILTPPIGFTVKKGNSIRVDISSHSDKYVPHSNVKGHWALVNESRIAQNTVICDNNAYIALPVCAK